jgi:16S rRNA (adenine1518-N6/adenine1519-N6)-dimethyltransferase
VHTKQELDKRLKQAGVQPLKKLGQNFLLNPKICQSMIDEVNRLKPETVIEIGPGLGALTDELAVSNRKLILIEIDSGFVKYWRETLPNVETLHKDALKLNWSELSFTKPAVLISNLPYSIAASLVVEMSLVDSGLSAMILMFQKEVAQRIAADKNSHDYGMLSVVAQTCFEITQLIDAGPQDFFPVPNVGSRVLTFIPRSVSFDKKAYVQFVKLAYSQRRKKLLSNLSARYDRASLDKAFKDLGLGENARAQELDVSTFQQLFNQVNDGVSGV